MKPTIYWRAAGKAVDLIHFWSKSQVKVSGIENIGNGPVLFVSNHFTRFETGLIPWIVYKKTNRITRTLADDYLFQSPIKGFLESVNVFSNQNPCYKTEMTRDLATNNYDWVIYPEGGMIKNKKVVDENGDLWLPTPWREGPPRTGCATYALMAESLRQLANSDDLKKSTYAKFKLDLQGPSSMVCNEPIQIIPITFSYYPLRPAKNFLHNTVHRFVKQVPIEVEDELLVEGNFLFGKSTIDIHFGNPIKIEKIVKDYWNREDINFYDFDASMSNLIVQYKDSLTAQAMRTVYKNSLLNIDHLLTSILYYHSGDNIKMDELFLKSFDLSRRIKKLRNIRIEEKDLVTIYDAVVGKVNNTIQDYFTLASNSNFIDINKITGTISINRSALKRTINFNTQRMFCPCSILLNEVKAMTRVKKMAKEVAIQTTEEVRKITSDELYFYDVEEYTKEYESYIDQHSKSTEIGMPELVDGSQRELGVVACHGYLAAPAEMNQVAKYLSSNGIPVYKARLAGHGTNPVNLDKIKKEEWIESLRRAIRIMSLRCKKVVVVGFSTGGLVATNLINDMPGVTAFCGINVPIGLKDKNLRYVKPLMALNRILEHVGIRNKAMRAVTNASENLEVNYETHYLNGANELLDLIQSSKSEIKNIYKPVLLIQSHKDPTVNPNSARQIYRDLDSKKKDIKFVNGDTHICVTDPCNEVHRLILEFCNEVLAYD